MKKGILKVKNSRTYVYIPEPSPGGECKDFFYGDDAAFAIHKSNLVKKASEVSEYIKNKGNDSFSTMIVKLREDAIAKSHRPTTALFNSKYPVIGGGDIGEMHVQINSKSLTTLAERIAQAKNKSEVKFDANGKVKPKVGVLRSEVSAIESFDVYKPESKCTVSSLELSHVLSQGDKELILELFSPIENSTLTHQDIESLNSMLEQTIKKSFLGQVDIVSAKYFSDNIISLYFSSSDFDAPNLIDFIDRIKSNPLVKLIYPAPSILVSKNPQSLRQLIQNFPVPLEGKIYPKVGLIDSGVRSSLLKIWVKESSDLLGDEFLSDYHADEMASILIGSKYLNGINSLEDDGCHIYDIWLPSTAESFDDAFDGLNQFSDWLYLEVQAAREAGYRIFSMSINFTASVGDHQYGVLASRLDDISAVFGVVFVVSVGNLLSSSYRPEWPKSEADIFKMLARHTANDKILQPSECVSAMSVGAINHINNAFVSEGVPTRYTLRGPSIAYGIKPDLVYFGGVADKNSSGLNTLDGMNNLISNSFGTSLAAPHIAKIMATLDMYSKESLSIVTLKALMLHSASIPNSMRSKELMREAREFTGYGVPRNSKDIIESEESSFTFVFSEVLKRGQVAEFNFSWPASLITLKGKCKGAIKMTLVYTPPIDRSYGQEYVRANVDASLQQEKVKNGEHTFHKEVHSIWDTQLGEDKTLEKNLVTQGFKWWPSKVYQRESKLGFGNSSSWRLRVKSQVRDGVSYPPDGIEFAVVVTIEDPDKKSNTVYLEMLNHLKSIGVEIEDIRISEEVRV